MFENLRFEAMSTRNPDFFAKKSLILASSAAGGSEGTRPLAPIKRFQTCSRETCTRNPASWNCGSAQRFLYDSVLQKTAIRKTGWGIWAGLRMRRPRVGAANSRLCVELEVRTRELGQ